MYFIKKIVKNVLLLSLFFSLFSCKTLILNKVSDTVSSQIKNGIPLKIKENAPDPMMAFMGETDPVIVQEVLPVILKVYEIMHIENPNHLGNQNMLGSLNVMYANLCVESKAEKMTDPRLLDEQVAEFERAKLHYMRGHDLIFASYDKKFSGFSKSVEKSDINELKPYLDKLTIDDVNSIYWACAGFFASFALNPLDINIIGSIKGHIALLERVCSLDPNYSNGAIWDVLAQIYIAAPIDFGGDYERGLFCLDKAFEVSKEKSCGIYVTKAKSVCIPNGDKAGFIEALETALKIDVNEDKSNALMNVLNQNKAATLLQDIDNYFIEW